MRVEEGAGYRVYFVQRGPVLIVLLCGGSKRSEPRDILRAQEIAQKLENEID
jgi:putative addiction module killer protein